MKNFLDEKYESKTDFRVSRGYADKGKWAGKRHGRAGIHGKKQ